MRILWLSPSTPRNSCCDHFYARGRGRWHEAKWKARSYLSNYYEPLEPKGLSQKNKWNYCTTFTYAKTTLGGGLALTTIAPQLGWCQRRASLPASAVHRAASRIANATAGGAFQSFEDCAPDRAPCSNWATDQFGRSLLHSQWTPPSSTDLRWTLPFPRSNGRM